MALEHYNKNIALVASVSVGAPRYKTKTMFNSCKFLSPLKIDSETSTVNPNGELIVSFDFERLLSMILPQASDSSREDVVS